MERLDRERYARHLLLGQVGQAGQVRLLETALCAQPESDPGARAVAAAYLERAGVRVSDQGAELPVPSTSQVERCAGDHALMPAARALLGALAAVDAIRQVLGLPGSPASDVVISSAELAVGETIKERV
jgi:hypothetical protein